jgi:hypothetical protein
VLAALVGLLIQLSNSLNLVVGRLDRATQYSRDAGTPLRSRSVLDHPLSRAMIAEIVAVTFSTRPQMRLCILAALGARVMHHSRTLLRQRGRRECRVPAAPMARQQ